MAVKNNLKKTQEFSESIIDTIREPLIILDHDLRVITASRSFYEFFKVKPEETVGKLIYDLGNKQWDIPMLRELLETILPEKATFDNYEVQHDFATIGKRTMLLNARQIKRVLGKERIILLAIEDVTSRRQLESLLIDYEEQYRRLFETASDGIVLLEKSEGKITQANPATEKLLGYTEKESIGNKLQNIGVVLDTSDFQTTMRNLNKSGIINYRNVKVETKSGQNIDTEIYLVDRAKLVQCNIRDITEHKKTQEALRASEELFRNYLEYAPDGIYMNDLKGNFLYSNLKCEEIIGYRREELIGKNFLELNILPKKSLKKAVQLLQTNMEGKPTGPDEIELISKEGRLIPVEISTSVVQSMDQGIVLAFVRDVTERKRAEKELRESNRRYREFFATSRDCVFITSMEGKWIDFNDAALDIFGYDSREELSQVHISSLYVNLEERSMLMALIEKQGYVKEHPAKLRRRDGAVIDALITSGIRQNTDGFENEYFGTIRDITAHKQAEEELMQSQRELQAIMDVSPVGICWADMQGNIQYNNQKFRDLFGYTVEDIHTIASWRLLAYPDPAYREQIPSIVSLLTEAQKQGKETDPVEVTVTCKDGSTRHVLQAGAFTSNRLLVTYADITDRKRAEDALRKNEEMYRLVVDNMADVIAIIDMNLRFTYISPSIVRLLEYTAEEATAQTLEQIMTPESLQIVTRVFEEEMKLEASGTADPGRIRIVELEEYRKDGSTVWLENRLSSFRDKEKKLAGIISLSHDITERKHAEEKLKESEKKYRLLADNVDDVIFVLDMNLNYTYASPSVKILLGYEQKELLKLRASETMTPSSWDLATKNLSKELEKYEQGEINKFQVLQLEMRRKDGSIVWTEVKVSFIRDENRRPVGIIGVTRDITERRRAEEAMSQSEENFRIIFEQAADSILILDITLEGIPVIRDANRATFRLLGYERDELVGQPVSFINTTLNVSKIFEAMQRSFLSRTGTIFEIRHRCKDGTIRDFECSVTEMKIGSKTLAVSVERDITERKQVEEEQLRTNTLLNSIIENIPDMIFLKDAKEFRFVRFNRSGEDLLGYSREEMQGKSDYDFFSKEQADLFTKKDREILRGKEVVDIAEESVQTRNKGERILHTKKVPLLNTNGEPEYLLAISEDITDRKRAEEELQQTLASLKKAFGTTIQVLISALEARDPYTAGHQLRVADLAFAIATEMGLDQDKIEGIRMAGSIHDIGKLSIPAEILVKPTKLTSIEFSLVKEHSQSGYEMLKDVESPWPLAQIVYQHHERMNGSGYPRNLKGDEIILEARIMAVADVVEAMASHRPYRPALGIEFALEEIEKNKGTLYDNTVVDACLKLFREKGYKLLA